MNWLYPTHTDADLRRFSEGDLSEAVARRLVSHARACARCKDRLERTILAHRALAGDLETPSPQELELLTLAARPRVLARRTPRRLSVLALAATLGALGTALALRPSGDAPEWQARGGGVAPRGALRVFCDRGGEPVELGPADACTAGGTLLFSVSAEGAGTRATLRLFQGDRLLLERTFDAQAEAPAPVAWKVEDARTEFRVMVRLTEADGGGATTLERRIGGALP